MNAKKQKKGTRGLLFFASALLFVFILCYFLCGKDVKTSSINSADKEPLFNMKKADEKKPQTNTIDVVSRHANSSILNTQTKPKNDFVFDVEKYERDQFKKGLHNKELVLLSEKIYQLSEILKTVSLPDFVELFSSVVKMGSSIEMTAEDRSSCNFEIISILHSYYGENGALFKLNPLIVDEIDFESFRKMQERIIKECSSEFLMIQDLVSEQTKKASLEDKERLLEYVEKGFKELPKFNYTRSYTTSPFSNELMFLDRLLRKIKCAHCVREDPWSLYSKESYEKDYIYTDEGYTNFLKSLRI